MDIYGIFSMGAGYPQPYPFTLQRFNCCGLLELQDVADSFEKRGFVPAAFGGVHDSQTFIGKAIVQRGSLTFVLRTCHPNMILKAFLANPETCGTAMF